MTWGYEAEPSKPKSLEIKKLICNRKQKWLLEMNNVCVCVCMTYVIALWSV